MSSDVPHVNVPLATAGGSIRMVVFDLGGVLVRICRSWQEACLATGQPYHELIRSEAMIAARKALTVEHERGLISCDAFFARLAETTGGLYDESQCRIIHAGWLLGEYPAIGDFIDDLHTAGIATGVLSNTNHAHWVRLMPGAFHGPLGADDRASTGGGSGAARGPGPREPAPGYPSLAKVQHPHASHRLGHAKPTAEIHRAFERAVGLRPAELLFFDDLPDNVEGARRAGWAAAQVDHSGDPAGQMRREVIARGLLRA